MGRERSRSRPKEKDGKKKKKRSASSESAERSREREKRRRKQQAEHVNKNRNQNPAGAAGPAAAGALAGGQRMFWDGFQWVPRADGAGAGGASGDMNASRKMRRLYLGNLPYHLGVTEDSFSKQLYETMKERGMCNDPNQNPVLHVWFARDKGANYGFCEIASIEETDRALQLDGLMVLGVPVSIKRPSDGVGPMGMVGNAMPGQMPVGGMLALPAMQVQATTSVIRIEEILKVDANTSKEDYDDVLEDMNEGCGAHGKVKKVVIVRPEHAKQNSSVNAGDVFLQCHTMDDATKIMRAMGHRKYDGRQINMKSHDEADFENKVRPLFH